MDSSKAPNQNLVVIREDHFVHQQQPPSTDPEDLPLPSPESSEPPSSSPSPSPAAEAAIRFCDMVKARVIYGISRFRGSAADSLRSVFPATAMAALLVVSLFWFKTSLLPWRRPVRDNQRRLLLLLKHKDEKISQLLLQIGQMTEILSARRRVPVVRIK